MKFASKCVFLSFLLCAAVNVSNAQQVTAALRGTVFDPSGATVASAKISVTQLETGFSRTVATNDAGEYTFVELPVGHYRIRAEAKGFKTFLQDGIALDVNETAKLIVHLSVGDASDKVEVHADAALIEGTSTNLGKTVREREILDLPLNGRNFTQLGLLQPGVAPITPGLQAAGGTLRDGQATQLTASALNPIISSSTARITSTTSTVATFLSPPWTPSLNFAS